MTAPLVMRRRRTPDAEPVALERRNVVLSTRTDAGEPGHPEQRADEAPVVDSLIWTRPVQRLGVKDSGLGRGPSNGGGSGAVSYSASGRMGANTNVGSDV